MINEIADKEQKQADMEIGERFYLPNLCTSHSLLFIVLAGTLLSIVFTLVNAGLKGFNWQSFSLIAMFVLWVILVSVSLLCKLRQRLSKLSLMKGSLASYALVLLVTFFLSMVAQWLLVAIFNKPDGFDGLAVVQQVLIAAILAGVSLRYLYLQEQLHVQQRAELASRIQALQSRIRPHFLFNSMNIIASLIETEPQLAERVVEDLSELFRATLSDANQLVPIQREVELGKSYLHIEGLRLGERLQVSWELDEELMKPETKAMLPHLSLQPLLENAVYHGIQPVAEGGTVFISIRKQGEEMIVNVKNPLPKTLASFTGKKGNKLALENLRRRLQAYYGNQAILTVGAAGDFFEVSVQCPIVPPQAELL